LQSKSNLAIITLSAEGIVSYWTSGKIAKVNKMGKVYSCTCCGSDVTVPYFYNKGVYGYTCIRKVNPNAKKTKAKFVKVDSIEIKRTEGTATGTAAALLDGKKYNCGRILFDMADAQKGVFEKFKCSNLQETDQGWFMMVKDTNGRDLYKDRYTGKSIF
jgi:hypothetical protein